MAVLATRPQSKVSVRCPLLCDSCPTPLPLLFRVLVRKTRHRTWPRPPERPRSCTAPGRRNWELTSPSSTTSWPLARTLSSLPPSASIPRWRSTLHNYGILMTHALLCMNLHNSSTLILESLTTFPSMFFNQFSLWVNVCTNQPADKAFLRNV